MRYPVNGTVLNVLDQGEGTPVLVFLHYFAGSSRAWSPVIDRLAGRHRCIAPDLRGFGDSDAPSTGYSVGDLADDVCALISRLGLDDYVVVGHSMGGKVALALAARRPPGLRALVLVAPSPPSPEPISEDDRAHLLSSRGSSPAARATAQKITNRPPTDRLFRQVVEDNLRTARPAWEAWLERGSREDITQAASAMQVPVLVIAGDQDETIPRSTLERDVVRRIQGSHLVVISEAKHLLPLDRPNEVANLIVEAVSAPLPAPGALD
jgi:pimeloyl-ACP methyl ester carboxylesterase